MGKYKFALDSVLSWRESQEEDAKRDFLVSQEAQRQQETILENYIAASEEIKNDAVNYLDINSLRQQYIYKNHLENEIIKQQETVDHFSIETEKMKEVFVDAQKERKIMDRLKEKHHDAYMFVQKTEEQKELDEMGTLRFGNSLL